jgi:hypothetical protein
MRNRSRSVLTLLVVLGCGVFATAGARPAFAGIHYKSALHSESARGQKDPNNMEVEGWVSGDKARVNFLESGNPLAKKGDYLITKDGGKSILMVDPEDKTYGAWDMQGLLGMMGGILNGMGPLLKLNFTDPQVEKLADEDGGTLLGLPTRHVRYRTRYSMTIKVLGMGNTSDVVTDQDIWTTQRLRDPGLSVWLRSEPPRTGNEQLDKLISAGRGEIQGFPLKTVTVSTSTEQKKGRQTVSRSTLEVTQLDASASVPASTFEIPAGYKETQMVPKGEDEQEQGGLRGLLHKKKGSGSGR